LFTRSYEAADPGGAAAEVGEAGGGGGGGGGAAEVRRCGCTPD